LLNTPFLLGSTQILIINIFRQSVISHVIYTVKSRAETIQEGTIRYTKRYRACDTIRDTIRFKKKNSEDYVIHFSLKLMDW